MGGGAAFMNILVIHEVRETLNFQSPSVYHYVPGNKGITIAYKS